MKQIPLTMGMYAVVDDDDFEWLSKFKWRAAPHRQTFYAVMSPYINGKQTTVRMHRLILKAKPAQIVDHKNCNGLDNQKSNLRFCTPSQNSQNRRLKPASGIKGVSYKTKNAPKGRPWIARITKNRRTQGLGFFATKEEAGEAYRKAAIKLFGEFANFDTPQ